jgi:hypothetical protein
VSVHHAKPEGEHLAVVNEGSGEGEIDPTNYTNTGCDSTIHAYRESGGFIHTRAAVVCERGEATGDCLSLRFVNHREVCTVAIRGSFAAQFFGFSCLCPLPTSN